MDEYYNVTTNIGDAEIANAIATATKLNITHIAFGDGNGAVPTPNKIRTTLVREVHRQAITKYERHKTNANWLVIETIIPSNVGGFTIREMGIIANGKLISHGSHAPFEKVADPTGVSEYRLKFTQNITDGSIVSLILDESLIYATQAWVDENYVPRDEIVDNLTTDDALKPVSAKQAKALQDNKLDKTATAAAATKLATARNIGGVAFDGTGNINLPGVNATGNQNTTGNAATATKLETARTINGVLFDGTENITVADATKAPLASPVLTGAPAAPTAADGTSTTQLATTAFVQNTVGGQLTKTGLTGGTLTLTVVEVSNAILSFSGALTSNLTVIVPTTNKRLWSVVNETTGAFTVTVKTAAGSGVTIAQGKRNLIYTDGSTVKDAFNDFESIALTGVSTAPTASVGTNTTQVATTAFVNAEIANDAPSKTGTGASGTWAIDVTGNAATATKLATARNIGGVAFDGTGNINLPGVNATGNQNTTGNAATATKLATATGSAPSFSARAWVNFNGATATIRASGNVSSITDNGVGDYTVNFTTAMPDANYAVTGFATYPTNLIPVNTFGFGNDYTQTLSGSVRVRTANQSSGGMLDPAYVNVTIHR